MCTCHALKQSNTDRHRSKCKQSTLTQKHYERSVIIEVQVCWHIKKESLILPGARIRIACGGCGGKEASEHGQKEENQKLPVLFPGRPVRWSQWVEGAQQLLRATLELCSDDCGDLSKKWRLSQ